MNQPSFLMCELKVLILVCASLLIAQTDHPRHVNSGFSSFFFFSLPPQRSRQRGAMRAGSRRWKRCGAADPLHVATVLLLRQRHHHLASLWVSATPAAAGSCGCQQEPGRAQRPSLHAGYGVLTQHSGYLLCNWKADGDLFHAQFSAKILHLFFVIALWFLLLLCRFNSNWTLNMILFFSHTESSGRALQTARSGDLLPGESAPWPVGAWTSPAGTLKGLRTGTFVARYWYTEGSLCSSRDDLECSRSSPLSLMTSKTMDSHSKTSETAGLDTGF